MRLGRIAIINLLGLLIVLLIVGIGFYIWHQGYYFYSTDDAVVSGQTANVASLVPGQVTSVRVSPNQTVDRGQVVVSLLAASGGSSGGSGSGSSGGSSSGGSGSGSSGGSSGGSGSSNSGSLGGSSGGSGGSSGGGGSVGAGSSTNATGGSGGNVNAAAPIAGTVLNVTAQPGQFVQPGQPLAQVADLSKSYITAYVDENHINDVHPRQGVDVHVDAYSDIQFHGTVQQIIPATASTFSLLPTNNYASGNFTKVAQRVPVIIALDGTQGKTLLPNTSASVTIHIHD